MVYTPQQMYELVGDVASYPEFLPWCEHSDVVKTGKNRVEATLHVRKGPLSHSFSTLNIHDHDARTITFCLSRGPLHTLVGQWTFDEEEQGGCLVGFAIHYRFSTRLLEFMLGPLFTHVYESMVDAFVKRAHDIYKGQ